MSSDRHPIVINPCFVIHRAIERGDRKNAGAGNCSSNLADLREEGGATFMRKALKFLLIGLVAVGASWTQVASADDVANASATNVQVGDNENETEQTGRSSSGDAVAGQ